MTHNAAIALGSNLPSAWGDREGNLREAIQQLGGLGSVLAVSSFYETEPYGYADQPWFLNGALLLETSLTAHELLHSLLGIEKDMGRERTIANGPRSIDLDLLLMDDLVLSSAELTLPHPGLVARRFVLAPLAEIAPDTLHPVVGCTIAELLARLDENAA